MQSYKKEYRVHIIFIIMTVLLSVFLISVAMYGQYSQEGRAHDWGSWDTVPMVLIALYFLQGPFLRIICDDVGIGVFIFRQQLTKVNYIDIKSITRMGFPSFGYIICYRKKFQETILMITPLNKGKDFISEISKHRPSLLIH